jgi:hypothetical protein
MPRYVLTTDRCKQNAQNNRTVSVAFRAPNDIIALTKAVLKLRKLRIFRTSPVKIQAYWDRVYKDGIAQPTRVIVLENDTNPYNDLLAWLETDSPLDENFDFTEEQFGELYDVAYNALDAANLCVDTMLKYWSTVWA